jgi:20S proteasome alpha/beta subunit
MSLLMNLYLTWGSDDMRKAYQHTVSLEDKYKDDITLDGAISLAIEAVKTASDAALQSENVKVAVVPVDTKVFRRLSDSEVQKHMR